MCHTLQYEYNLQHAATANVQFFHLSRCTSCTHIATTMTAKVPHKSMEQLDSHCHFACQSSGGDTRTHTHTLFISTCTIRLSTAAIRVVYCLLSFVSNHTSQIMNANYPFYSVHIFIAVLCTSHSFPDLSIANKNIPFCVRDRSRTNVRKFTFASNAATLHWASFDVQR